MHSHFDELYNYMKNNPVISTHSHHLEDNFFGDYDLDKLLKNSYVDWCGIPFDKSQEGRQNYLNKVRYNSYFMWLQRSIQEIYDINEMLTPKNWDGFSNKISEAHRDSHYHINLLKNRCGYRKVILDTYWNPGSNNGYPKFFTPTYRINSFLFGYNTMAVDHNGNSPFKQFSFKPKDIDEYIDLIRRDISDKKQKGCIALKSALAYDRGLDFTEVSKDSAQKVFEQLDYMITDDDIKVFQDYVFFEICKIAAEFDLPLQCHTGLGILKNTRAINMREVIEKNPDTKFVLFHCSYPWVSDVCALTHNYKNVFPDLCWTPLISTSACKRILHELIEVGTAEIFCWGCDTWTAEESYGALLAVRYVLADVFSERISQGFIDINEAKIFIDKILYLNARKLYNL